MRIALKGISVLIGIVVAVALLTFFSVPNHTTDASHFDAIIVLGYPSDDDGQPSLEQRSRVMEAVREFKAGRAKYVIMTGAAAHNQWVEAESMARLAEKEGVPAEDVVVEPKAHNTIENIFYSNQLMQQHGWSTAEVISSPSHLPRTGLILAHYRFGWRTHKAPWPYGFPIGRMAATYVYEVEQTAKLRWFGFSPSRYLPN